MMISLNRGTDMKKRTKKPLSIAVQSGINKDISKYFYVPSLTFLDLLVKGDIYDS